MADYTYTDYSGKQVTDQIMDEGVVYQRPDNPNLYIIRQGNTLYQTFGDKLAAANYDLSKAQLAGSTLVGTTEGRLSAKYVDNADPSLFLNSMPKIGETITKTTSATNPYGMDLTSNVAGGYNYKSGSLEANLAAAGATPEQIKIMTAAAAANAGAGPGGTTGAFSNTQLTNAGVPNSTNTPTTPTPASTTSALPPAAMQAQTLYDFYAAQGQTLPPLSARGTLYQQLTGRPASTYTGSAEQNNALLAALKAQGSVAGAGGATGAATGTPGLNSTPTGGALAGLTGMSASEVLKTYGAVLSAAMTGNMAKEQGEVDADRLAINNFFSTRKSSEQILKEEFARRGIEEKNSLLSELDKEILAQTRRLRNLPENIKQGLQDVGVTQGQLDRLVVAESRKPAELLRDLLENRNALANDIETATKFAEKFTGTILEDQAAKLAALQWQLDADQDDVKNLQDEQKTMLSLAVNEQKSIMELALDAAKNGAPQSAIDQILASKSALEATRIGATYLTKADSGGGYTSSVTNPGSINTNNTSKLPSYEEWVRPYLATAEGQALSRSVGGDNIKLSAAAREVYARLTSTPVVLGKLTPSQTQSLTQAGLTGADTNTKAFYLSTEPAFQDLWVRNLASGQGTKPNLSQMQQLYTEWQADKKNSSSSGDIGFDDIP